MTEEPEEPTPAERRAAMTWAQRLKRVLGIDVETCPTCRGAVRIIACIEDPVVRLQTALNPPSMAQRFGFHETPARPSVAGRSPAGSDVKSLPFYPAHPHPPRCERRRGRSYPAAAVPGAAPDGALRLSRPPYEQHPGLRQRAARLRWPAV